MSNDYYQVFEAVVNDHVSVGGGREELVTH